MSPWATGSHQPGTSLSLAVLATGSLGALVAEIHAALAQQADTALGPAGPRPRARLTDPETAISKADRLLGLLAARGEVTGFDVTARRLLEERKVLIGSRALGHLRSPGAPGRSEGQLDPAERARLVRAAARRLSAELNLAKARKRATGD